MRPLYYRSPDFEKWCRDERRHPGWAKIYDCKRCVITEQDVFPFFTELEGRIIDRTHDYLILERERTFLTDSDSLGMVFEWVVENTSGKFTLTEREGYEGVMFDLAGDYLITRLMFADRQALIMQKPVDGSWCQQPPYWR